MTHFGFAAVFGAWVGLAMAIAAGICLGLAFAPPVKVQIDQGIELSIDEPVKVEAAHPILVTPVMPPKLDDDE